MLSGPIALWGFNVSRSFLIPGLVISILGIVGTLSNLSKFAWMGGEGFEKTESNCLWIRLAFFRGSLMGRPFSVFKSGIPTFSCFLLLMYEKSFLLEESSENIESKCCCLFVCERRPRIGFHHLRWTNGRQSRITPTQVTVLRGL